MDTFTEEEPCIFSKFFMKRVLPNLDVEYTDDNMYTLSRKEFDNNIDKTRDKIIFQIFNKGISNIFKELKSISTSGSVDYQRKEFELIIPSQFISHKINVINLLVGFFKSKGWEVILNSAGDSSTIKFTFM